MQQIKSPTHPCLNCIYFKACGETNRTTKRKRRNKWLNLHKVCNIGYQVNTDIALERILNGGA